MRVALVICLGVLIFVAGVSSDDHENEELEEHAEETEAEAENSEDDDGEDKRRPNEHQDRAAGYSGGFSYHKFRGPVSGAVREVPVPGYEQDRYRRVDYVARPDYSYSYGVDDPKTGNLQTRQESRDGNSVKGEYRVVQPDGKIRIVKYTAGGPHGFQATVHYEDAA